jgi:hypothetical protein
MQKLKAFLTSTPLKRFYWTTADGFLGYAIVWVGGLDYLWTPIVIAVLVGITKGLNNYYSE